MISSRRLFGLWIDFRLLRYVVPFCLFFCDLQAQFTEKASAYGVNHLYTELGSGAGLSLVDFNGDGLDDLSLATGQDQPLALYIQSQDGLVPFYQEQLFAIEGAVRSVIWVDYDNDGDKDLFLTIIDIMSSSDQQGSILLMRQEENGSFTDVTEESGLAPATILPYGCSWADFDNDGHLDLHLCNYSVTAGGVNFLYHNLGDGTFENIAADQDVLDAQGASFCSSFFDADLDGDLELFVANDRKQTHNNFYSNDPVGSFNNITDESGLMAFMDAMGVEIGDYDADGDLDLYVTNAKTPNLDPYIGNTLFKNEGELVFSSQINFPFDVNTGTFWGCSFLDFDFDRDLDLFTVNSNRSEGEPAKVLLLNDSLGTYSAYSGTEFSDESGVYFGLAQGDVDGDGFIDLVTLQSLIGQSEIWAGPENDNGWIRLKLEGVESNRDAVGAIIEVWVDGVKRIDQTSASNSYCSQDSDTYPFGLGSSAQADSVIIHWPSGIDNTVVDIPTGTTLNIVENIDQEYIDCIPAGELQYDIVDGLEQLFAIESGANIDSILWFYNDIPIGSGNTLYFDFPEVGDYAICAILYSECTEIVICDSIAITCTAPIAAFDVILSELMLSASTSTSEWSLQWSIDGELQSSAEEFNYTFDVPGQYELCLIASNTCGADTICQLLEISCTSQVPIIEWESEADLMLSAGVQGSYDTVSWYPGDGTMVLGNDLEHTYELAGEYELCVVVSDLCGSDSTCVNVEVECPLTPAQISWSSPSDLLLQASIEGEYDEVTWYPGDGSIIYGNDLEYSYELAGEYELCVLVSDICGTDSTCVLAMVDCPTPFVSYTWNQEGQLVMVSNESEYYDLVIWTLDDEIMGGDKVSSFEVDSAGVYQLCLEAINDCGSEIFCDSIQIQAPVHLEEDERSDQLFASPNPSDGQVQIYFESPRNEKLLLTILDLMGRELSTWTFIKSSPRFETTIDISSLPQAAYILRLNSFDGTSQELLLIKE